jgi:hypothetical protein
MRLPDNLAAATRTEFTGIGGWRSGDYTVGPYSGRYERSADRLSFFGASTRRAATASSRIAGPTCPRAIEGRCRMRESSLDLGLVEVTTRPMAYRCEFSAGERQPHRLARAAGGQRPGTPINRYVRYGRIELDGETVEIRSVHHLAGTSMPVSTPIGYVFEQRGRPVGAVELNGRPRWWSSPAPRPSCSAR